MKTEFGAAAILLAASATSYAMDPKILRLIGDDARVVAGLDVARFRSSALLALNHADLDWVSAHSGMSAIRQVVSIVGDAGERPLLVLEGAAGSSRAPAESAGSDPVEVYRGYPIAAHQGYGSWVRLDETTVIMGEAVRLRESIDRWSRKATPASDLADTVQRLGDSYDLWFLAVRPLDLQPPPTKALKYRAELVKAIEEVRGGVRLGSLDDATVEILARTSEDAATLAALGRWLPGLMQLVENPHGSFATLAEMAQNFSVRVQGRSAVITFSIPEKELEKLSPTEERR